MHNQICVSSYSLGELLGPIRLTRRGPDGKKVPVTWGEGQPTLTLLELPAQIKTKLGLDAVEICQFHVLENTPAYLILDRCARGGLGRRSPRRREGRKDSFAGSCFASSASSRCRCPPARNSGCFILCTQGDRLRLPWP